MAEYSIGISRMHPNVCRTLDLVRDDKGDLCEVMEFCAGGDLYSLILAAGKLEPQEADCFFKQMMRGVEYLHEMGVAHRDLKPENLLLTTRGALKITDFGNGECFRYAWEDEAHMVTGVCGSAPYIAPEEYVEEEFDGRAVDVWACGVIYMAMRTGRHMWNVAKKDDDFYKAYVAGRKSEDGYAPIEILQRVSRGWGGVCAYVRPGDAFADVYSATVSLPQCDLLDPRPVGHAPLDGPPGAQDGVAPRDQALPRRRGGALRGGPAAARPGEVKKVMVFFFGRENMARISWPSRLSRALRCQALRGGLYVCVRFWGGWGKTGGQAADGFVRVS
jgi:serine/threonine protein kinase